MSEADAAAPEVPTPAPEATPEPPVTEPAVQPTVTELVEDDTIDLESTDLPAETIAEIKNLRKQTKKYRETATSWESATADWTDSDLESLRTALEAGPSNPQIVGEWMMETAKQLLGELADDRVEEEADDDGELTSERVAKIVADAIAADRKERETMSAQERQVQKIMAETTELGFGPSHPMHESLLLLASRKTDGDLTKAAELLKAQGVAPAGADATSTTETPAEAGNTPVPPEGVTPSGTQRARDGKTAAQERLDAVLGTSRDFGVSPL